MNHRTTLRGITLIVAGLAMVLALAFAFSFYLSPASAEAAFAAPLCGEGSAPDYGFSYNLQQAHWTVAWQDFVSVQTVTKVDVLLDSLNGDSIAQTMILFQSPDQVGTRVNRFIECPGKKPGRFFEIRP